MTFKALKHFRRSAVILVAIALTTTACGSSNSEGGSDGSTVKLGLLTSLTGPLAGQFGDPTVEAVKARIALANDTNEVPGVKIELVVKDDQSTPEGALAATQILVDQEHVHAIIDASALFAAAYKLTVQRNVPVMGWADSTEFSDPANKNLFAYFGSPGSDYPPLKNLGGFFQSQGATKVCRLATADVPAATNGATQFAKSAEMVGLPVTYSADIPRTVTDMSTYALALKDAGCDSLVIVTPTTQSTALFRDLANLGVVMKATLGLSYNQERLDPTVADAYEGLTFLSQYEPLWMDTPATKRVKGALEKYAGLTQEAPPSGFYWGWMPADLAIYALKLPGATTSAETLIDELRKVTDYDADGFICPVDFTKQGYIKAGIYSACLWMSQVEGGHFVAPPNLKLPISLSE